MIKYTKAQSIGNEHFFEVAEAMEIKGPSKERYDTQIKKFMRWHQKGSNSKDNRLYIPPNSKLRPVFKFDRTVYYKSIDNWVSLKMPYRKHVRLLSRKQFNLVSVEFVLASNHIKHDDESQYNADNILLLRITVSESMLIHIFKKNV